MMLFVLNNDFESVHMRYTFWPLSLLLWSLYSRCECHRLVQITFPSHITQIIIVCIFSAFLQLHNICRWMDGWMFRNDTSAQFRPFSVLECLEIKTVLTNVYNKLKTGLLALIKFMHKLGCKLLSINRKYVNITLVYRCIRLYKTRFFIVQRITSEI